MKSLQDSTVAIIGLGLMGGSLALALHAKNACRKILGITRNPHTRAQVLARGIVANASADLDLAAEADIIILATPTQTILKQIPQVGTVARAGAIIMDLGSTKREIICAMQALPAHLDPIGAHPMCGKETFGFDAADANLYHNAAFVLTPLERTSPTALALAQSVAIALGARPIILDAVRHDRIVAAISHLPFTLAAALMTTANEFACTDEMVYTLAASGFRDTTRLAASDTTMMLDILLTNRENVVSAIHACSRHLAEMAEMIDRRDASALRAWLERAAISRRQLF